MFLSFDANGGPTTSEVMGDFKLADGESSLALRYVKTESGYADKYFGKTDAEVAEQLLAQAVVVTSADELAIAKLAKIRQLRVRAQSVISGLEADAAPYEVLTWPTQREEYTRWLADVNAVVPYVAALASARNMSIEALMGKIGGRVAAFAGFQGKQHALETAIEDAVSIADLESITIPF